jgi:radical SAM/Cys-rich protein
LEFILNSPVFEHPLARTTLRTLQVNLGKLCNQACTHCHVDAGPTKTKENMSLETVQKLISKMQTSSTVNTLDLTGGAPELNPHFRTLVREGKKLGWDVIDRCNLTVLFEPGQEDLSQFLAENNVHVVASLPCYTPDTLEKQRGEGVFEKSIAGLQQLNALGYGKIPSMKLDLVYNPSGAFLPPEQKMLEADYRERLLADFGIEFSCLFALTNLPVKRFAAWLKRNGELEKYYQLLVENFNPKSLDGLMCRSTLSISWDGRLFDCDFNQMMGMRAGGSASSLDSIVSLDSFSSGSIATASHCFGCTAGAGSSCTGQTI